MTTAKTLAPIDAATTGRLAIEQLTPVIGAEVEPASPPVGGDGSTRPPMMALRVRPNVGAT